MVGGGRAVGGRWVCKMKLSLAPSSSAKAGVGLSMAKMSVGTSVYFEEQHEVIRRDIE